MVLSENSVQIRSTNTQGQRFGAKIGGNRRALSEINQNLGDPCVVVNKRGYPGSNGVFGKKEPAQEHGLTTATRKSDAQMAVCRNPCQEVAKKPKTLPSTGFQLTVWEDDEPVPMATEQSEFQMAEKNDMEEVEMEDIFEEAVVDIDSDDAMDPLAVSDYVGDLYAYYKKMESASCVSPGYMTHQPDINEKMRAILIDWLIEVHHKFDLRDETLFLTVNLIDRFLAKQSVVRKKLQLVGLVAMLLACKYEEVSVPVVDDLVFISDKAYSRKEVIEMESLMLNTLQFNMSVPTPYVFVTRFLKAAQSDKKLEMLAFYLIELCLVEYEMLKYPPSLLASVAVYTAQSALYGVGQWSRTCEWHTGYSEDQLMECARLVVGLHGNAATGKLTGVHRKYSTSKFGYAARCEPANFIVQTPQ